MAIEDLDLEFEDDEEVKEVDAISVDVDLSFGATPEKVTTIKAASAPSSKAPSSKAPSPNSAPKIGPGRVRDINEARTPKLQVEAQEPTQAGGKSDFDYEMNIMRDEIKSLKDEMQFIKNHADVKVAVAEAKGDYMIEYITDAKLLNHQVNQILQRIHGKVPGLKPEVLALKKYMNEFIKKTNKKE